MADYTLKVPAELVRREVNAMLASAHFIQASADTLPPESEVARDLNAWAVVLAKAANGRRLPGAHLLGLAGAEPDRTGEAAP
jgi:hypothetical protein